MGENRDEEIRVGEQEEQETRVDIGCCELSGKEERPGDEGWESGHMLSML